jgi:hypothetical protein
MTSQELLPMLGEAHDPNLTNECTQPFIGQERGVQLYRS